GAEKLRAQALEEIRAAAFECSSCDRCRFHCKEVCALRRSGPHTMWAMPLLEQIQKDMIEAMKAKDESRLSTVRMIKAALKKQEIDSMKPLDEATELQVMNTLMKQRREAADQFRKGGREDLAEKEESELGIITRYLPPAPTSAELEDA